MSHYLYLEIDGIQRFVFASPRLKNIRGGSAMLDRFNRVEMVSRVKQQRGATVVFVGGGHCLVRGLAKDDAEQLGKDLERELRRQTEGQATLLWAVSAEQADWPSTWRVLKEELAHRRLDPVPSAPPLPPFVALCWSCGAAPAQELVDQQERHPRPHCRACLRRLEEIEHRLREMTVWPRLRRYLGKYRHEGDDAAFDALLPLGEFQDLANQSSASSQYLAYLYCDGNGMGRALSAAKTDEAYGNLSRRIDDSLHQAVAKAIVEHCAPVERAGRVGTFRVQILLLGGDDLIVALPASCAIEFTMTVLQEFCRANQGDFRLSAGLVFAPPTTPASILQRTADALLRSAKRRAYLDEARQEFRRCTISLPVGATTPQSSAQSVSPRERAEGYIDFQELAADQTDVEREDTVTCRPYRLDDFMALVKRTRAVLRSRVPRSRLHALSAAIQGSLREAFTITQWVVGRAKTEIEQDALLELLQPPGIQESVDRLRPFYVHADQAEELPFDLYRRPEGHRFSPIPDAIELIDHLHLGPTHEDL